jgi:predicted CXXCH cytochrome family protein
MNTRLLAALAGAAWLAACGHDAPQYQGAPPPVDAVYGQCAFCHDEVAAPMYAVGGHGGFGVNCETCHNENVTPGVVGPNHRSVPACADCHTVQKPHMDPAAGTPQQCLQCHDPHGSPNLRLIREAITTPEGNTAPIEFTNRLGRADGSFASATDPGTGVCETCHTATLHYNNTGTAVPHQIITCPECHLHSAAFAPPFLSEPLTTVQRQ